MIKLTVKQLEAFASVARYGNLSDAADSLHLTKGAVSQALQQLEQRLETPLFDRVHPRLRLNSEGLSLQPLVEDVLSRLGDIEQQFLLESASQGYLRLGASQTIGNYLLPRILAQQAEGEEVCPDVRITNTHRLCEMLLHFELDMALIEGESHHPELVAEPWLDDEMLVVCAPGHPLVGCGPLRAQDLSGNDWVLREQESGSREQFDLQLQPKLTSSGRILQLNTLEAVMLAVEQGLGLTLISKLAAARRLSEQRLVALPLDQHFPRTLKLIWHRKKYHTAPLRRFVALCHSLDPQSLSLGG